MTHPLSVLKAESNIDESLVPQYGFKNWLHSGKSAIEKGKQGEKVEDEELAYKSYRRAAGILQALVKHPDFAEIRRKKPPEYYAYFDFKNSVSPTFGTITKLAERLEERDRCLGLLDNDAVASTSTASLQSPNGIANMRNDEDEGNEELEEGDTVDQIYGAYGDRTPSRPGTPSHNSSASPSRPTSSSNPSNRSSGNPLHNHAPPPPNPKPAPFQQHKRKISGAVVDRMKSLQSAGLELGNNQPQPGHTSHAPLAPTSPPSSADAQKFPQHQLASPPMSPPPNGVSPSMANGFSYPNTTAPLSPRRQQRFSPLQPQQPTPLNMDQLSDLGLEPPKVMDPEELPRAGSAPPMLTPRVGPGEGEDGKFPENQLDMARALAEVEDMLKHDEKTFAGGAPRGDGERSREEQLASLPSPPLSDASGKSFRNSQRFSHRAHEDSTLAAFEAQFPPVPLVSEFPSVPTFDPSTGLPPPPQAFDLKDIEGGGEDGDKSSGGTTDSNEPEEDLLPPPPGAFDIRPAERSPARQQSFGGDDEEDLFPNFNKGSNVTYPGHRPAPPPPKPSPLSPPQRGPSLPNGAAPPSQVSRPYSPLHPAQQHPQPRPAAPPAATNGMQRPPSLPDLPISNSILPQTLWQYLSVAAMGGKTPKILLLDIRPRDEFKKARIQGDVVCLEPLVLRKFVSSPELENSLVLSPPSERQMFADRERYDRVVVYDPQSTCFPDRMPHEQNAYSVAIYNLFLILFEREFRKQLKAPPMLLVGGWKAWEQEIGLKGMVGEAVRRTSAGGPNPTSSIDPGGYSIANGSAHQISQGRPRSSTNSGSAVDGPALAARRELDPTKRERRRALVADGDLVQHASSMKPPPRNVAEALYGSTPPSSIPQHDYFSNGVIPPNANGRGVGTAPTIPAMAAQRYPTPTSQFGAYSPSPSVRPTYPQPHLPHSGHASSPVATPSNVAPPGRRATGDICYPQPSIEYNHPSARMSFDYPPTRSPQHISAPQPPPLAAINGSTANSRGSAPVGIQAPRPPPDYSSGQSGYQAYPTRFGNKPIGITGLKNLGNTCYMNSTVQCLSATVPLASFFKDGTYKRALNRANPLGTKGHLAEAFGQLVRVLWSEDYGYVSPVTFRQALGLVARHFLSSDQQDAQEFLTVLLDGLHEDLNLVRTKPAPMPMTPERERALETLPPQVASEKEWQIEKMRNDSLIVDMFQGQFRSRLQCLTCGTTSTTYNTFNTLSLPIPGRKSNAKVTLHECFDALVREETLEKGDAWNCPKCKTQRKTKKTLSLSRLPPVMVVHLKRFSFHGPFSDKLETFVQYPLQNLDLTGYLPPPLPPSAEKAFSLPPSSERWNGHHYDLFGVVNHFGSLSSGHYTAFVRNRQAWMNIGDSKVQNADPSQVMARSAYMLYYARRQ